MANLASIEQRFLNPQSGDLDTVLPDATLATTRSVVVFNVANANIVTVRAVLGQLIDGVATSTVVAGASSLFVTDGAAWRSLKGGSIALSTFLAGVDQLALEDGGHLESIDAKLDAQTGVLDEILEVLRGILEIEQSR